MMSLEPRIGIRPNDVFLVFGQTAIQPLARGPPPVVQARLRTEPVTLHAVPEVVMAPGEVSLDLKQVAKITSRIDGQAEQIHAQLGDHVKKGQPLVAIGASNSIN
jgi:multidrug efflux pump subunit AcrA (membrane-fusion protein)